jgi:hypothetical protein
VVSEIFSVTISSLSLWERARVREISLEKKEFRRTLTPTLSCKREREDNLYGTLA